MSPSGGYISTRHEVESFMRCTLGWQQGATEIQKKAEDALERLAAADLQFVTAAPDEVGLPSPPPYGVD